MERKDFAVLFALANIATCNADGFTVDRETLKPIKNGYAVAVAETQDSFGVVGLANVVKFASDHKNINAFGGWFNSEDGQYYFDATIICKTLAEAVELGKKNGQKAVYDLKNNKEIRL